MWRFLSGCLIMLTAVGCGAILGLDEYRGHDAAGSPGGTELCTNGVDDDGDGAVDCEDDDCVAFVCAPAAPAGFDGPITVVSSTVPAPACSEGVQLFVGGEGAPDAADASCTACDCIASGGCTVGWSLHSQQACSSEIAKSVSPPGCFNVGLGTAQSVMSTAMNDGISCAASGGDPTLVEPSWARSLAACEPPAGSGCSTQGERCIRADAQPAMGPCVYAVGDVGCDSPSYPNRIALHQIDEDTRGCAECSCAATAPNCPGDLTLYDAADCSGTPQVTPVPASVCYSFATAGAASISYAPIYAGSCIPSGGEPQGAVVSEVITLCCAG